jgi:FixJ family two-component response regulator
MTNLSQHIVVVEDDPGMCHSLNRLLTAGGLEAEVFQSAEALLETDAASRADCLVVDIRLPGLGGLGLVRELEKRGIHHPVIFITALDEPTVQAEVIRLGARGFFLKPFLGSALLETIREIL